MSQLVSDIGDAADQSRILPDEDFDYHPVPPLAPITLFLGICGIAGLIGLPALSIGVAGIVTGLLCLWQIRRAEGELGGAVLAKIGLFLSVLFLVSGSALHAYTY